MMELRDDAVEVFNTLAKEFTKKQLMEAQERLEIKAVHQQMGEIRIPIITDDEDVKRYIRKFQLDKPQNMIKFFVEANFAALESIEESINVLQFTDMANSVAKVESAKRQIDFALENPRLKESKLSQAQNELFDAMTELENKIKINIEEIRKIDNRSPWQFFLKSRISISKIDTYCNMAKWALDTLITAFNLQMLIANCMEDINIESSVIRPFRDFINSEIIKKDTCLLMHAYDKDKASGYWLNVPKIIDVLVEGNEKLMMYVEDYLEEYDDIDFS